jgi:excisionase family DNA binding protein
VTGKLLLTRREAADALSVSVDTLERLIKNAEIQAVRIGRAVRVPASEVTALVERRSLVGAEAGSHGATPGGRDEQ